MSPSPSFPFSFYEDRDFSPFVVSYAFYFIFLSMSFHFWVLHSSPLIGKVKKTDVSPFSSLILSIYFISPSPSFPFSFYVVRGFLLLFSHMRFYFTFLSMSFHFFLLLFCFSISCFFLRSYIFCCLISFSYTGCVGGGVVCGVIWLVMRSAAVWKVVRSEPVVWWDYDYDFSIMWFLAVNLRGLFPW